MRYPPLAARVIEHRAICPATFANIRLEIFLLKQSVLIERENRIETAKEVSYKSRSMTQASILHRLKVVEALVHRGEHAQKHFVEFLEGPRGMCARTSHKVVS
jgi:hypothetical protein